MRKLAMPELPEVETIRLSLLPILLGRKISQVEILTPGVWLGADLPPATRTLADISRRGKYLIFHLAPNLSSCTAESREDSCLGEIRLVVHLRMTGRLLLQRADLPAVKHDHVRLRLDLPLPAAAPSAELQLPNPIWLVFHDTRRFGRIWLLQDSGCVRPSGLDQLGPEPLDPGFSPEILAARLAARPHGKLKAVLLDQAVVAGLGNIYADEVLFASGLHPACQPGSLDDAAISRLCEAIVRVLRQALACQGTSLRDYVDGWDRKGAFQDCLMVYGRAGQPCRHCGNLIRSVRLAGRTTCWCPACQPDTRQS
jgi:formamidopyrimidine-DNA glycosylase